MQSSYLLNGRIMVLVFFLLLGCQSPAPKSNKSSRVFIGQDNELIQYQGRITQNDSTSDIFWSGSSVKITFEGTAIKAILNDQKGDNYFNVIIDEDSLRILRLKPSKETHLLAEGLSDGKHTVELFKRTEWTHGTTNFYGFEIDGNILETPSKEKHIEFYGNSITSGYAVEDYSGADSPDSVYTNNYNSYAAVTARHFDANYTCISRSGIGITISWYPQIMPELYNRHNPSDPNSLWDFTQKTPDVVVINLLQNDSWLTTNPEHEQFKIKFGNTPPTEEFIIQSYAGFVQSIRNEYSGAPIICLLGNMDITKEGSAWPEYVREAVGSLADENISTLIVPFKNTLGHPRVEEQIVIAESLIQAIENKMNW